MDRTTTGRADNVIAMPSVPNAEALVNAEAPASSDIARRAYELYEMRGRVDGADVNDWLQAERELIAAKILKASQ
jgi:outer membrane protein TolC